MAFPHLPNIVGYAGNQLREGAKIISAQFAGVANVDGEIDIQSIKAIGDDCSDNVFMTILNPWGGAIAMYCWVDYGGESGEEECWVDGDTYEKVEGVSFVPGQALWIEASSEEQSVQSAGEVFSKETVIQLCEGATMVGNSTPLPIDIQDIPASGEECSDNIFMTVLNAWGGAVATYCWVDYGGESGEEECWVDGDTYEKVEGVTIAPGEGVWVEASSDSQYLTIPAIDIN